MKSGCVFSLVLFSCIRFWLAAPPQRVTGAFGFGQSLLNHPNSQRCERFTLEPLDRLMSPRNPKSAHQLNTKQPGWYAGFESRVTDLPPQPSLELQLQLRMALSSHRLQLLRLPLFGSPVSRAEEWTERCLGHVTATQPTCDLLSTPLHPL